MAVKVPPRHRKLFHQFVRWNAWVNIYDRDDATYGVVLPGIPPDDISIGIEPDPLERETTSEWQLAGRQLFISGQGIS